MAKGSKIEVTVRGAPAFVHEDATVVLDDGIFGIVNGTDEDGPVIAYYPFENVIRVTVT